jgi:hypothetical protein
MPPKPLCILSMSQLAQAAALKLKITVSSLLML